MTTKATAETDSQKQLKTIYLHEFAHGALRRFSAVGRRAGPRLLGRPALVLALLTPIGVTWGRGRPG